MHGGLPTFCCWRSTQVSSLIPLHHRKRAALAGDIWLLAKNEGVSLMAPLAASQRPFSDARVVTVHVLPDKGPQTRP